MPKLKQRPTTKVRTSRPIAKRPRSGPGRPPKIVVDDASRGQIETMAALGLTQEQICLIVGISQDTLTRRFPDSLKLGKAKAIVQVAQSLYRRAVAGDNVAALFYLRCQGGWIDKSEMQLSGPDGGPIATSLAVRFIDVKAGKE